MCPIISNVDKLWLEKREKSQHLMVTQLGLKCIGCPSTWILNYIFNDRCPSDTHSVLCCQILQRSVTLLQRCRNFLRFSEM